MRMTKRRLEYIRLQGTQKFDQVKQDWIDCGNWALPHRTKYLNQQVEGARANRHIVDQSHALALRSYVAGFMEGNTSAQRPWFRQGHQDEDRANFHKNAEWLEIFTRRCLFALARSNFYHEAGAFYYDYGVYNTGAHYIEELESGLFFHTLVPGSYKVINGPRMDAKILIREFRLNVRALVEEYGLRDPNTGNYNWNVFSDHVRNMWDQSDYNQMVDVVHIIMENEDFDPNEPISGTNRPWVQFHYESGTSSGQYYGGEGVMWSDFSGDEDPRMLRKSYNKRKPFIVGKSQSSNNFEYGETGPTLDCLGMIKSLNKKAIAKDMALEKILEPTLQGPMNVKKSYLTHQPRGYIPLDSTALAQGGLKPINQIGQGFEVLLQDVSDLRRMVDKFYYADFLMFLSQNPKTRTAAEVNAVVSEQQIVIGPNLQSLNFTYNTKVVDFIGDYVLDTDPYLPPPPEDLQGQFLRTEFISVFAQAQKAADLPSVERYMAMIAQVGQINPSIFQKVNLDKLADLYENRLYLPSGINRPQKEVDAMREQAQAMAQQQQMLQETLPAVAGAAKDLKPPGM